jgi:hypothetical protein
MGARGPTTGCGDITAWIIARLKEADASAYELSLGSGFTAQQIHWSLKRLRKLHAVRHGEQGNFGERSRRAWRYHLPRGGDYAESVRFSGRARSADVVNTRALRGLHEAWHRVVSQSTAPP